MKKLCTILILFVLLGFSSTNLVAQYNCSVNAGYIATDDGETEVTVCVNDITDIVFVDRSATKGEVCTWLVTTGNGDILSASSSPPFSFRQYGVGTCRIYSLCYEGSLYGLKPGGHIDQFQGCFDLSNPIYVTTEAGSGGELTTADGETEIEICAGDGVSDAFDVVLTGDSTALSTWIITDAEGTILDLPAGPPFDLDGAGEGVCLIWNLSSDEEVPGIEVGSNVNDLEGCLGFSNPITVNRTAAGGASIATTDGETELNICAGDGISDAFDVEVTGADSTATTTWIITDAAGIILDLPAGPPFDLDGAGPGTCLVWLLVSEGDAPALAVGDDASTLGGCSGLSNPITVNRGGAVGGDIAIEGGATELDICAGDGVSDAFDVTLTGNSGSNSAWVITDEAGTILDLPAGPPFDLDGAGAGTCLIWHLSFEDGLTGAEVGMSADSLQGCFGLSNPLTIRRELVNGGSLTIAPSDSTAATICVGDSLANVFQIATTDSLSANYQFVVTNDSNQVISVLEPGIDTIDFEGAGFGICRVYGVGFSGNLTIDSAAILTEIDLSDNCFALSDNFIEVTRDTSMEVCMSNLVANPEMSEVSLFPNPVAQKLNIDVNLREAEVVDRIIIFNGLGQIVFQKEIGEVADGHMYFRNSVSTAGLEPGVKFITIITNRRSITQQFVKQKE